MRFSCEWMTWWLTGTPTSHKMNKPLSGRSFCAHVDFTFHTEQLTLWLQYLKDPMPFHLWLITWVSQRIYFGSISFCFKTVASSINSREREKKRGERFHLTLASDLEPFATFCFLCLISFHRRLIVKGDIICSGFETPAAVRTGKQLSFLFLFLFFWNVGRKQQRSMATQ